jgi:hypothetical protein
MVIKTENGRNTQVWWFDQKSLTIRTKLNNQSWDIKSAGNTEEMQIWSTNSGWFQIFKYDGEHFTTWDGRRNKSRALDVDGSKDEEGRALKARTLTKAVNQKFKVVYLDKYTTQTEGLNKDFNFVCTKPFYLVSKLEMHRVMELQGATNLILNRYREPRRTAQQFWFDCKSKTIKSQQYKDRSIEINNNGKASTTRMTTTNSRWW